MAFITVAGENQIAAKQGAAQVLNITHFVLAYIAGLGAEPANRIEAMPAAGNIKATLPVTSSGYVNGNQVVYSLVMDSSLGDYDFNWVGLKDADGVLIACTYTPTIQKRKTTGAIPGNNLTRNFLIAFSGIQATTAIAVPAATWQIDFNARLHGIDERERLSNYDNYGREGFFGDGWKVVRDGATTTYNVQPGVGYVGGIRIASAVSQPITVAGPPKSVWLDVSLQGDISDVSAVVEFVIDAVVHADYTDGNGFNHFVIKIADIAADGSVTDTRVSADLRIQQVIKKAGLKSSGIISINSTVQIEIAAVGGLVQFYATATIYPVLPAANSVKAGDRLPMVNEGVGEVSLSRYGTDTIKLNSGAGVTGIVIKDGDTLTVESDGVNTWHVVDGTAKLPQSKTFTDYVASAVAAVVNSAPAVLDTLSELAAALGNDSNFATTIANTLSLKAPLASPALTGAPTAPTPDAADNGTRISTTAWVRSLLSTVVVQATEAVAGIARIATLAELVSGASDALVVSVQKLKSGLAYSLAYPGYIALPSWLGGWIVQITGSATINAGVDGTVTLPIAVTQILAAFAFAFPSGTGTTTHADTFTTTTLRIANNGANSTAFYVLIIGK